MTRRGAVPNPATLGVLLQQARLACGMTQQEVAAALGITQAYVSELESGKSSLALTRIFDMMRLTGMTLQATIPHPSAQANPPPPAIPPGGGDD